MYSKDCTNRKNTMVMGIVAEIHHEKLNSSKQYVTWLPRRQCHIFS